jgi:glycosyltransferase involved in cell wall biosynthesis
MPLLLVLGYVWPEPKSSAAGWRMLSLLKIYQNRGWRVVFACAADLSPHRFDLAQWQIEELPISVNDAEFANTLAGLNPDVVLFDRFMIEEQFGWKVDEVCPRALKVLDSEDLHFWREARQQAYKQQRPINTADLHSELAMREIAAIYRCDLTLTISNAELELLQQHFAMDARLLCYCPLLLSPSQQPLLSYQQRVDLCFIGNFRHEPNWQTVLKLKALWPQIRQRLPGVNVQIWGAYPPPKATALHNAKQGFLVNGWAADAHVELAKARLLVAPIPFGAGQKGKILDAALMGTPTVTSSVGAEGLTDVAAFPGEICDDDHAFIDAVVALYQDEARWQTAAQHTQQLVEQFHFDRHSQRVYEQLEAVRQDLTAHRSANFIGAMLKHHHHRSTKYMGQWIEAKNRANALQELQQHATS